MDNEHTEDSQRIDIEQTEYSQRIDIEQTEYRPGTCIGQIDDQHRIDKETGREPTIKTNGRQEAEEK
jgi:hypothetical protein